jgi:tetratricopeptide (TPR) repeat protein
MREGKVIDSSLWVKRQIEGKLERGHFKSTIPLFEKLIRLGRNSLTLKEFVYGNMGHAYLALRRFDKAEDSLKKAVKLNPHEPRYHYLLGLVYSASGMISDALEEFECAVRIGGDKSEYQRALGWAKFVSGQTGTGIRRLKKALDLDNKNVYAYADLASCYMKINRFNEARRILKEGLLRVPGDHLLLRTQNAVERTGNEYEKIKEEEKRVKHRIDKIKDFEFHKVRKSLLRGMRLAGYSETQKKSAEKLWYDFYKMRKLQIRRAESWAAALEYTIARLDFIEGETQKTVASKYGVSETIISSRFNDICRTLDIRVFDKRYSVGEDFFLGILHGLSLRDE